MKAYIIDDGRKPGQTVELPHAPGTMKTDEASIMVDCLQCMLVDHEAREEDGKRNERGCRGICPKEISSISNKCISGRNGMP